MAHKRPPPTPRTRSHFPEYAPPLSSTRPTPHPLQRTRLASPRCKSTLRRAPLGSSEERELALMLQESLVPAMGLGRYLGAQLEVSALLLWDGSSALAAALALADAGVEMSDLVVGCSLSREPAPTLAWLLDHTLLEEERAAAGLTVALMPVLKQAHPCPQLTSCPPGHASPPRRLDRSHGAQAHCFTEQSPPTPRRTRPPPRRTRPSKGRARPPPAHAPPRRRRMRPAPLAHWPAPMAQEPPHGAQAPPPPPAHAQPLPGVRAPPPSSTRPTPHPLQRTRPASPRCRSPLVQPTVQWRGEKVP
nr:unnamed protein product [Rangifer tarandus platyrhynchus]